MLKKVCVLKNGLIVIGLEIVNFNHFVIVYGPLFLTLRTPIFGVSRHCKDSIRSIDS